MAFVIDYFALQQQYEKEYGPKTILLKQKGAFFDTYEYNPLCCTHPQYKKSKHNNQIYDQKIGRASEISPIVEYIVTMCDNKKPYSIDNPNLVGIPCIAYEKNRDKIIDQGYVIVRSFEIEKDEKGKVIKRGIEIDSAATILKSNIPDVHGNNIVCLYIEYMKGQNKLDDFILICGISAIDVTTGYNVVGEFHSKTGDNINALQEIFRFLLVHKPKEMIIYIADLPPQYGTAQGSYANFLRRQLELDNLAQVLIKVNEVLPESRKIAYQEQFLQKLFPSTANSSTATTYTINPHCNTILHKLHLDHMSYGRISYILLLQFCNKHNQLLTKDLKPPITEWLDESHHLILTHNAIRQLDLTEDNPYTRGVKGKARFKSLFDVLNMTSTKLGAQYLYDSLLNPLTDVEKLESRYDMIAEMQTCTMQGNPIINEIEQGLKSLPDICRLQRRLRLCIIKPKELVYLIKAYFVIGQIINIILCSNSIILKTVWQTQHMTALGQFLVEVSQKLDVEGLECSKLTTDADNKHIMEYEKVFLLRGVNATVDTLCKTIEHNEQILETICRHLDDFINGKKPILSYRAHKKNKTSINPDKTQIITTVTRAKALESKRPSINAQLCGQLQFLPHNKDRLISSDIIAHLCTDVDNSRAELRKLLYSEYVLLVKDMSGKYQFDTGLWESIMLTDFAKSQARTATKYG